MTNTNLIHALYYGALVAAHHKQSNFARELWAEAERQRKVAKMPENDRYFNNNRQAAMRAIDEM